MKEEALASASAPLLNVHSFAQPYEEVFFSVILNSYVKNLKCYYYHD